MDVMIAGGGDELLSNDDDLKSPGDAATAAAGSYLLTAVGEDGAQIPVVTTAGNYKYVGRLVVGFNAAGEVIAADTTRSGPVRVVGEGYPDGVAGDPQATAQIVGQHK